MAHDFASPPHALRTNEPVGAAPADLLRIVGGLPIMIFTLTAEGEVEWLNQSLLDYFGRSLEDLRRWRVTDAIHPEDLPQTIAVLQEALATGRSYEMEHRFRRADGVYRWFHSQGAPLRSADGRVIRWYGIESDIDDLKCAHEALHASVGDLRLLIDSIPALVYTMTPTAELELVNRQMIEYFGRTFEELKQWDKIGCVHPDDLLPVLEAQRCTVEFGKSTEHEQRLLRADGVYRWFRHGRLPLRDSQGAIVRWYGLLVDIDNQKRAEEDLRTMQARFARAAHLASLSELAASIAHEVNQPIAAMSATAHACLGWLSADPPNVERARISAERVVRDANSAAEVVSRIRSLFRQAPAVKQLLSINEVIEEVCGLMAPDLGSRSVVLRLDLGADLGEIAADRVQLQQLLANLVRNAVEAMDGVRDQARELTLSSRQSGEEIVVRVTDCGVGLMAPDAVFDAFYTTKPSGMGMGLAICRTIIEAHDGRLWMTPHEPQGTTFAFALPTRLSP